MQYEHFDYVQRFLPYRSCAEHAWDEAAHGGMVSVALSRTGFSRSSAYTSGLFRRPADLQWPDRDERIALHGMLASRNPAMNLAIGNIDGYEQVINRPVTEGESFYYSGKKEQVRTMALGACAGCFLGLVAPVWANFLSIVPCFSIPQHTLLTQVVCDYTGAIRWASIGRPGAMTDRSHYKDTPMYKDPDAYFTTHQVTETLRVREHVNGDNIYLGDGCAAHTNPAPSDSKPFALCTQRNMAGTAPPCFARRFVTNLRDHGLNRGISLPCRSVLASVKSSVIRKVPCVKTRKRLREFNSAHYSERVIVENSIGRLVRLISY